MANCRNQPRRAVKSAEPCLPPRRSKHQPCGYGGPPRLASITMFFVFVPGARYENASPARSDVNISSFCQTFLSLPFCCLSTVTRSACLATSIGLFRQQGSAGTPRSKLLFRSFLDFVKHPLRTPPLDLFEFDLRLRPGTCGWGFTLRAHHVVDDHSLVDVHFYACSSMFDGSLHVRGCEDLLFSTWPSE